jgi:hypothetical protein
MAWLNAVIAACLIIIIFLVRDISTEARRK